MMMMRYIKIMISSAPCDSGPFHISEMLDCSQNLISAILFYSIQGDLFSEAPNLPVTKEEKPLNESMKSTAQAAGKAALQIELLIILLLIGGTYI